MDKEFITAQAEQDQQWMALDDWYAKPKVQAELMDVFETLDYEPKGDEKKNKEQVALIRKMNKHGLEIVRVLALHCLQELMLREKAQQELTKQEGE